MNWKDNQGLIDFRKEYESSGLNRKEFALSKGLDYWKVIYALRKAKLIIDTKSTSGVGFKKVIPKSSMTIRRELRIKTSYGLEINIPL